MNTDYTELSLKGNMMTKTLLSASTMTIVATMLLLLWSAVAFAETIGAKVVFVRGKLTVHPVDGGTPRKLELGDPVTEGDRIVTGADGIVEIRFDNGDLIRIDRDSDLRLSTLRKNPSGTRRSIFDLTVGRVKSWVSKLVTQESQFDYHTKAAVAGVAGTPPFIVSYDPATETTEVDLLGAAGDEGKVFVQGRDPASTRKIVYPLHRTVIVAGQPPKTPFPIDSERLRRFEMTIPFESTRTEEPDVGRTENLPPATVAAPLFVPAIEPVAVALDTVSRHVSQPVKPAPGTQTNTLGSRALLTPQQGSVGELTTQTAPLAQGASTVPFQIDIGF